MARRDALGMLSTDERERLGAVVVDLGYDRTRTLPTLIQGWADHVDRLVAERDLDPDDGTRWTPYDLVAALHIRDFVDRGLRDLPADLAAAARRAIDPVAAAFREFTAALPDHPAAVVSGTSPGRPRILASPQATRKSSWVLLMTRCRRRTPVTSRLSLAGFPSPAVAVYALRPSRKTSKVDLASAGASSVTPSVASAVLARREDWVGSRSAR